MARPVGRRKQQRWVVGMAIGVLVALVGALALAAVGDLGGDEASVEPTSTTTTVPLGPEGRELLALLDKGTSGTTFHARYSASSAEEPTATITIETWRKPPRVRQDSEITSNNQRLTTSVFVLGDVSIRCGRFGDAAWSCQRQSVDEADSDALFSGVREQLGKGPVTAKDDVVDGQKVRCFTLSVEGKQSEMCLTSDGIPVRVRSSEGATMRLVGFDPTVSDEVFVPPAEPS